MNSPQMEVEQIDRDAAADYLDACGWDWGACGDIRHGRVNHPVVQAFARHRLAALSRHPVERDIIEGVEVSRDAANSHCFSHQIVVAGECVAFANDPWADRIAMALSLLPTKPTVDVETGAGWQPIHTAPMWQVAVVTNGQWAEISQRAESDDGNPYWAIDPEDGLDWSPTHWMPLPGSAPATPSASEVNAELDLRDALDRLGYDKVFRAIGDAVQWQPERTLNISVEKLIAGLTGVSDEDAPYLSRLRAALAATRPESPASATKHPWYGPCDRLAPNDQCAECLKETGPESSHAGTAETWSWPTEDEWSQQSESERAAFLKLRYGWRNPAGTAAGGEK